MKQRGLFIILASMLLFVVGCNGVTEMTVPNEDLSQSESSQHESSKGVWQGADVSSYRFRYKKVCFCEPSEDVLVTVVDGKVTDAVYTPSGAYLTGDELESQLTINELFDLVEQEQGQEVEAVNVSYNDQLGYPEEISIVVGNMIADSGIRHIVSDFESLSIPRAGHIWTGNSERIVIHQTGGATAVNKLYDYTRDSLNDQALTVLRQIQVDNDDLQCWSDAFSYKITITDKRGRDRVYFDNVNVCNDRFDKSHIDESQINDLLRKLKQLKLTDDYWILSLYGGKGEEYKAVIGELGENSLKFNSEQVVGNFDCNTLHAQYLSDMNLISFGTISLTEMFCLNAADTAYIEQTRYIKHVLEEALTYRISGEKLTITASDGGQLIYFNYPFDQELSEPSSLKFSVLHQGLTLVSERYNEKGHRILQNQQQYERDLTIYSNATPSTPNFSEGKVVRLDMGEKSTGGFLVSVSSVIRYDDYTLVKVINSIPSATCPVPMVLTNPYQFVWVPSRQEIVISEEFIKTDC